MCCAPYLSKHTSYDCVFVAQVENDDIFRCIFHFFKILVFWVVRGDERAKSGLKWQKIPSHSVFQELSHMWLWFWYSCLKWWYLQQFFFFFSLFQNSDFSGFSKFINKCQKEILRCAQPSSYVCDFYSFH